MAPRRCTNSTRQCTTRTTTNATHSGLLHTTSKSSLVHVDWRHCIESAFIIRPLTTSTFSCELQCVQEYCGTGAGSPQVKNSQAGVPLFATRQKGDGLLGMDYPEKGPAALPAAASSKRIKENAFRGGWPCARSGGCRRASRTTTPSFCRRSKMFA